MRNLVVVATPADHPANRFHQTSVKEARNLRDFLALTGEFEEVAIFEAEEGAPTQWTELEDGTSTL